VSEGWVLNASPLILFARINALDIIDKLANPIIVPDAVIDEIRAGEADDASTPVALGYAEPRRAVNLTVSESISNWDLGLGESQVICRAILSEAWAVVDDLAARRCAKAHHIPIIGSLGIILRAKRRGFVDRAAPWITRLKTAGMYIDGRLVRDVLGDLGEVWEGEPHRD
jgi:predicted nucleic acid-binding protein